MDDNKEKCSPALQVPGCQGQPVLQRVLRRARPHGGDPLQLRPRGVRSLVDARCVNALFFAPKVGVRRRVSSHKAGISDEIRGGLLTTRPDILLIAMHADSGDRFAAVHSCFTTSG